MLAALLLAGLAVGVANVQAATLFYGPPYTIPSGMWDNPRFPSIAALDAAAWARYRSIWGPAGWPNCWRTVTPSANGRQTNSFGLWCVHGQCSGCGAIVGTLYREDPFKNPGPPQCGVGNPINPGTGNKYQQERDWAEPGGGLLSFVRHYNSSVAVAGADLGARWRHHFARSVYAPNGLTDALVMVYRADGRVLLFRRSGASYAADADTPERLTPLTGVGGVHVGWRLVSGEETETFDAGGRLTGVTTLAGRSLSLSHDAGGRLTRVEGQDGRALVFSHDANGRLATLTTPDLRVIRYAYDDSGRLATVAHPDASGTGTVTRRYHYENTALPQALTGISDENGARHATWAYDAQGRGVLSEHAGQAGKVTLRYLADGSTEVAEFQDETAPNTPTVTRRQTYTQVLGVVRTASNSRQCAACGTTTAASTYDANGNVASITDFVGNRTCYAYDLTRNLETRRLEGLRSSEACATALVTPPARPDVRIVTTTWHADFRQPLSRVEPGRTTTWVYDAAGRETARTLTDTTVVPHVARTVTTEWHVEGALTGRIRRVDGPRTDVNDVTTYAYYTDTTAVHAPGDLAAVTNAAGHVTHFTRYDGAGRVLEAIDANGVVTHYTWHPRGWLASLTVAGATTTFGYDGVGQLIDLRLPTGEAVRYRYDAAHRLTGLTDALGQEVGFDLDLAGNRRAVTVRESVGGALVQRETRRYDTLGRLSELLSAAGVRTTWTHDAAGRPSAMTVGEGAAAVSTTFVHDALDRLTRVTDALAGVTTTAYDAQDAVTRVVTPNGAATGFTVNGFGEAREERSPDRGTLTRVFDAAGNRVAETDARGITTGYAYDGLNRLTAIDRPGATEDVSLTWDAATGCTHGVGRLCAVTDASGVHRFAYDARGNRVRHEHTLLGVSYVHTAAFD
ncbi:MAG TPA: hypothetical protein DCY89_00805, partial [Gammaproteobacteria bacterium]|nr:hypothetical protein [Gammaproteobacteria bacterium]